MSEEIETRKCSICEENKTINSFYKRKEGIYRRECKNCFNERVKKNIEKNPEKYKKISKEYSKKNKEKIDKKAKDWYENHKNDEEFKNKRKIRTKERYYKDHEETKRKSREIYKKRTDKQIKKGIETRKKWYKKNEEKIKKREKKYRKENRDKINESLRKHANSHPQYRVKKSIAQGIRGKLKRRLSSKNNKRTFKDILPYTIDDLMIHLESKFKPEMNWKNYGRKWHIDHVVPDSWFKYKSIKDEGFKKSWALENLQPMLAEENWKKNNKFAG